jgi:hypothetical protein
MKKSRIMKAYKVIFLTLGLGFVFLGCERDLETINTNPNAVSEMDPAYLFSNAVKKTFRDEQWGNVLQLRFGAQYSHFYMVPHNTARPYDQYRDHFFTDTYFESLSNTYTGPIKLINEVIRLTSEGVHENELRKSLADVVAVCNYMKMTDLFGDVPYTEGGYGLEGILLPKYDAQSFIYEDMLARLEAALAVIKAGDPMEAYPGFDPLYDNNLEHWARFTNSLRLRMAMRIRFVDESQASRIIQDCMEEQLVSSNEQNARIITNDDPDLYNRWNRHYEIIPWKVSQKLVDWLSSTNDPRLAAWVKPNSYGAYAGAINGLNELAWSVMPWDSLSDPTTALYARDMPVWFLCASETKFYEAEAALIGLNPGADANQLYREGIRLAMEKWEIHSDTIELFLESEATATLSGELEPALEQIGTQLWLSLATNFVESYNSIRRLGYPLIPRRTDPWLDPGVTDGYLPKRLLYPYNEEATNSTNLQEAIDRQGPNEVTTAIWWDIRDR